MVYANLRAERARAGMTQAQVASRVGKTVATISRYENGSRELPADVLVELSDLFGCSADYLLGRTDERRRT